MHQKIIVTGANGGLGTAVTQKLLDDGYDVHGTIIPGESDIDQIKDRFNNKTKLNLSELNVLDEPAVERYMSDLPDVYGAVLTVGGFMMKSLQETSEQDLDRMIALNFKSAFYFTRHLIDRFKSRGKGRIFYIAARPAIEKGGQALTAYALSKNMLVKLAEMVNEALGDTEASATVIAPDMIDTPANRNAMPDADYKKWINPHEMADIMAFYLSSKADRIREPIVKIYGNR